MVFRKLKGAYFGENQAVLLLEIADEYAIRNALGYFVLNNTDSNSTIIRHLLQALYPVPYFNFKISYLLESIRRLRYFGYVLNIIAISFIKGISNEVLQAESQLVEDEAEAEERLLKA